MKTKGLFLYAMAAAWISCTDGTGLEGREDTRVALRVSSGIEAGTRAAHDVWSPGDRIGIYMFDEEGKIAGGAENRSYRADAAGVSSTFSPQTPGETVYFPIDGSTVSFRGYYPHQATGEDGTFILDVADQIDLQSAYATDGYTKFHPDVAFKFYHRLTKIRLEITAGIGLYESSLDGLQVSITNQNSRAAYHPGSDGLELAEGQKKVTVPLPVCKQEGGGCVAEAILLPTEIGGMAALSGRQLVFTLSTGESFYYDIPASKDHAYGRGKLNRYVITINRTELSVTSSIEEWEPDHTHAGSAE